MAQVAVVTGGNRGLGLEAVRQLAQKFEGTIYLTARNEKQGQEAADKVSEGAKATIKCHQLDVTDSKSIEAFKNFLQEKTAGIDILINNAGIYLTAPGVTGMAAMLAKPTIETAKQMMNVNYHGVKNVTEALKPLLKPHSRVVIVASRAGNLREITNEMIKKKLLSPDLTIQQIDTFAQNYLQTVKDGDSEEKGYTNGYSASKVACIAYSLVLSRSLQNDSNKEIISNACCPGFVATDLNEELRATLGIKVGDVYARQDGVDSKLKTVQEGADTIVYLALLPKEAKTPNGQFVAERRPLKWGEEKTTKEIFQEFAMAKAAAAAK